MTGRACRARTSGTWGDNPIRKPRSVTSQVMWSAVDASVRATMPATRRPRAAPGVPDFYQGTEFWDLTLVDPDNRRPVDFAHRTRALDDVDRALREELEIFPVCHHSPASALAMVRRLLGRGRLAPRATASAPP